VSRRATLRPGGIGLIFHGMSEASLYDADFMVWTERQAEALRAIAAMPGLSNSLDWENLIEEVETLGRSELSLVESNLLNALVHVLKGVCDSGSLSVKAWDIETFRFLEQARRRYVPSMRQRIDMEALWKAAFREAMKALTLYNVIIPPNLPERCPFTLDQLLDENFDFDAARRVVLARMTGS
jgi:hypothetical protein